MWKSMRVDKCLGCESSLEAYLWICNMTLEDNLGHNLCSMLTTCHMIVILDGQKEVGRMYSILIRFLVNF